MFRLFFLFLYLILITITNVFGQKKPDYLWPTNASEYMSSSFCEYRPGHYHSALDIKTWNREGYPCYAIANGVIDRIRVSPFGYGKVLYLKLDDGNYAVYAHLQKFADPIEAEIFKAQLKNKRYTVNFYPKNWRVKKGEIIAYTGQTGIGVPHLHFEIRDRFEHPVNPLHYYNNIKDTKPPVLKSILVIPLTKTSRVAQFAREKSYTLTYVTDNNYSINEPIYVSGKVGLAIDGYDLADDVYNKFSFYKKNLYVNGEKLFESKYDVFDFDLTNQIDIEIFYPERVKHKKTYQKLYIEPYNQLPFYQRDLGTGMIETGKNDLPFRIEISDFWGNTSTVNGTLIVQNTLPAKMQLMKKLNDLAYLRLELPSHIKDLSLASATDPGKWQDINYFEILERQFGDSHQTMLIKATLNEATDSLIKTTLQLNNDKQIETVATFDRNINLDTRLQVDNTGKFIALNFHTLKDEAHLELELSNQEKTFKVSPEIIADQWEYVLDGKAFENPRLDVKLKDEDKTIIDTALTFYTLLPEQYQQFSFYSDSCMIESKPESVYDTLLFEIDKTASADLSDSIPALSPVFVISSAPQVMKKGVNLKLKYTMTNIDRQHLGLFKMNGEQRFSYLGGTPDSANNIISCRIGSFGKYFVGADTVKPEVIIQYPKDGQELTELNRIKFSAKDALSGIGSDKNICIIVDDRFVLPEWDPERDIISGKPHWEVNPGPHNIVIRISDEAGNISEQKLNINIRDKH